jgi:zinc D-Ala-D-Ala carboxypeptidase
MDYTLVTSWAESPGRWPNFSAKELQCSHTGELSMADTLLDLLQAMRSGLDKPLKINSGFRAATHPIESVKDAPGTHSLGLAVDISTSGKDALDVLGFLLHALQAGFENPYNLGERQWLDTLGIGVKQSGPHKGRFLHVDVAPDGASNRPRPTIWSYA